MLFDLRSKSRRRTVQVIYLGLAIVMGGGLVLFGVGTGNGNGGLLNSFTGNGSSSGQNQAVSAQTKAAEKTVRLHPTDPAAWSALVQAQWTDANSAGNYNSTAATFTAGGKKTLAAVVSSYQRYTQLAKTPAVDTSILAARAYGQLGRYAGEATAWENVTVADPSQVKGYECLAVSSYAAKQTRKGDLAAAKAISLVPKLQRVTLKAAITAAKTQPSVAASC
jgi:hypothetical protein